MSKRCDVDQKVISKRCDVNGWYHQQASDCSRCSGVLYHRNNAVGSMMVREMLCFTIETAMGGVGSARRRARATFALSSL